MRESSAKIKDDVSESLVQLQFQDRVSQILGHVSKSLHGLPQAVDGGDAEAAQRVSQLIAELERSFTTHEERATGTDAGAAVTFF